MQIWIPDFKRRCGSRIKHSMNKNKSRTNTGDADPPGSGSKPTTTGFYGDLD